MSKRPAVRSRTFLTGIAGALVVALASQSACAQALPKRKAGLWEITMTTAPDKSDDASRLRAEFENVPPEKRAFVEAQMQRMGLALPSIDKDGSVTVRKQICLTPQEADEELRMASLDKFSKRDNCDATEISRTSTEVRYSAVCRAGGDATKVDLHVYRMTPEGWSMDVKSVSSTGKETMVKQTTRWLGAECGSTGKSILGMFAAPRN